MSTNNLVLLQIARSHAQMIDGTATRKQTPGAPYLAGFSRDVGYHSPTVVTFDPLDALKLSIHSLEASGDVRGIPHLAKNERATPNFLYAALDEATCAPFFKERRLEFLHFGEGGYIQIYGMREFSGVTGLMLCIRARLQSCRSRSTKTWALAPALFSLPSRRISPALTGF